MSNHFQETKERLLDRASAEMQQIISHDQYSIQEKLVLSCHILFDAGHGSGLAGQITARGEDPDTYYTQQFGLTLNEARPDNLLLVDADLRVLEGQGMANPANRFHSWLYRQRPDAKAIIHTHPPYTSALSMLEVPLVVSHMDNCILYDQVAFVEKWPGIPFGNEEGELFAKTIQDKRAIMLAHHGMLVLGQSVEEACVLAVTFEKAAQMQLMAMSAGVIKLIDHDKGVEAQQWLLKPSRTSLGFSAMARQSLLLHPNCLAKQ
jgi:L-fuculose-phosphate aldolase